MKYMLGDGKTEVEIVNSSEKGASQTSRGQGQLHSFSNNENPVKFELQKSLRPAIAFCEELFKELKDNLEPEEIEIEVGIEAGAEGGLFGIAKIQSNATITVKAKWAKNNSEN